MPSDLFTITLKRRHIMMVLVGLGIAVLGTPIVVGSIGYWHGHDASDAIRAIIPAVSAEEIYPRFVCTCCDQPLDKNNICCGIAEDMIHYIDEQVGQQKTEMEVMLATVRHYGMESLATEALRATIAEQLASSATATSPRIELTEERYDFGNVSEAGGEVATTFTVMNAGAEDLVITNLLTSCGCTSATLTVDGQEGPRFGMHNNPTDWSATISAGDEAVLTVYYDPTVHPDLRGPVTREITIFSNDPVNFQQRVKITLEQVD